MIRINYINDFSEREEYSEIQKFVKEVERKYKVKFNESSSFTGISYYATIRGHRWRIANHAQTQKWARIYGWVPKDKGIIIAGEIDEREIEKRKKIFMTNLGRELKKPKVVEYVELEQQIPVFKKESDIKKGMYKIYVPREGNLVMKILEVDSKNKKALVKRSSGEEIQIPFKYIMNWIKLEKHKLKHSES